jgi:hypothetical protein
MRIGHVEAPVGEQSVRLSVSDANHRKFPLRQSLFVNRRRYVVSTQLRRGIALVITYRPRSMPDVEQIAGA